MPRPKNPKVLLASDGRPTSNRLKFRVEHIRVAAAMAKLGATQDEIADACSVDRTTFQRWIRRYDSLREATKIPREVADDKMEHSLFKLGQDRYVEEEEIKIIEGQLIKVKLRKFVKGDPTAAFGWLNNRRRAYWSRNPEPEAEALPTPESMDITPDNKREVARRFSYLLMQFKRGALT